MNGIRLASPADFNFMEAAEGFKNFLIKYDSNEDSFKIGFMAKRDNPNPGELMFYPVWITKIEIAPVVRQMFGSDAVDLLMANPKNAFWLDSKVMDSAGEVIERRAQRAVYAPNYAPEAYAFIR